MNKLKFISFNYIRALLLILIFIYFVYLFISPQEALAMDPYDIIRSFNPDTYIPHELDGTPINDPDKYKYHSHNRETYYPYNKKDQDLNDDKYPRFKELDSKPIYEIDSYPNYNLDPTAGRYELQDNFVDIRTLQGKLRYDLEKAKQLSDTIRHKMYIEAKMKQRSCGRELPVHHKKVLGLPKTDCFDDNKYTVKGVFSRISRIIDNKSSGVMDPRNIEEVQEMRRRRYYYELKKYNGYIKRK